MNKKFSTLMASLLLASAFSTSAVAAGSAGTFTSNGVQGKPVSGDVVLLFATNVATDPTFIQLQGDGTLKEVEKTVAFKTIATDATAFTGAASTLWKINVRYSSTTGQPIYQFVNKATGAYLAIDLKTDNNGASTAAAKLNAAGNKDWSIDADGNLYAYKGTAPKDSVFTLKLNATDKKFYLNAKAGNSTDAGLSTPVWISTMKDATANGAPLYGAEPTVNLDAKAFNAMLGLTSSDGKLHFNGTDKDVTTGQTNLLTAKNYVAYDEATAEGSKGIFLAEKENVTSINKNPYLLMVDTLFHNAAAGQYNKLKLDTLSVDEASAKKIKESTFKVEDYASADLSKFARPINASLFKATYYYANDSIALNVAGVPKKVNPGATITDGKAVKANANALPNYNNENIDANLKNAVTVWFSGDAETRLGIDLSTKVTSFAEAAFAVTTSRGVTTTGASAEDYDVVIMSEETPTYYKWAAESSSSTQVALATASSQAGIKVETNTYKKTEIFTGNELATAAQTAANALTGDNKTKVTAYITSAKGLRAYVDGEMDYYFVSGTPYQEATTNAQTVALTELAGTRVLTVALPANLANYIKPLVQPFTTTGGDAVITTSTKLYRIQIANTTEDKTLKATADNSKYLVATGLADPATTLVESVDDANVYAQWAFIPGEAGFYQIINRGSEYSLYSGPVSKVKDANGNVVADTYVVGPDTLKLAGVTVTPNVYEEKDGKFDYSGYFYAGPTKDKSYTFSIAPVAAIMTDLGAQFNKDSVMVLGKADEAPVWYFQEAEAKTYGLEIEGMTQLKYMTYKIFTKNANGDSLYVWKNGAKYSVTNKGHEVATFALREANKGQYLFLNGDVKMTINPTPAQPVLEASDIKTMRDDYFTIESASSNAYRTLTEEDGVLGNAKIYMNNEPYRYLYENTANIVANNGNKIAKDSLNFLGIYNAAAASKNAALYVDTAYVDRKGVTMPQYMFALGVEAHEATPAANCTESGVHVDKDGKPTTADKCVHATPAKKAYKSGRYLVSVADSASTAKHPAKYDGAYRLAFVEAIHVEGSDSLIIVNSKYTNNTNAIESGKATTYASKDTLKFENDKPNVATFALLIKDQADKSFYLETANKTYVRILNGVPVLTDNIENAAIFNIEATTEEATANEAIEAAGVQVIGGQGVVTVQGAAGKVITVANILGQTIANQVATSDNVTIAAPAGVVVVAVDGDATKVVVK